MSARIARQIVVRVPEELHDALTLDAIEHGRTLAQSARFHLMRAVLPAEQRVALSIEEPTDGGDR